MHLPTPSNFRYTYEGDVSYLVLDIEAPDLSSLTLEAYGVSVFNREPDLSETDYRLDDRAIWLPQPEVWIRLDGYRTIQHPKPRRAIR